jgi:hypothetical protein
MTALNEKCLEALRCGVSIQQSVRKVLSIMHEDNAADHIAEEMGLFRQAADTIIDAAPAGSEQVAVRKRVNNVINDVSRICREEIGKSIKLKARKGGYVYKAEDWEPKPKATPSPAAAVSSDVETINKLKEQISELEGKLALKNSLVEMYREAFKDPTKTMEELVSRGTSVNDLGKAVVEVMRRSQS